MAVETLLADNRLSEAARILGVWILSQPSDAGGWVEVRFEDVRGLLYGFPSDETIGKHLRMLRGAKWAERRPGGRGHADRYRIIAPTRGRANDLGADSGRPIPEIAPTRGRAKSDSPDEETGYGGVGGAAAENLDAAAADADGAGARETERAREVIDRNEEKLAGCRSALRDYLEHYVPPRKRAHYAWGLIGYMDNPARAFKRPDGRTVADHTKQAEIIAEALNELGAGGEDRMKWPVGDIRNLKTKIGVIIQQETDGFQRSKRNDSGRSGANTGGASGPPRGEAVGGRTGARQPPISYGSG